MERGAIRLRGVNRARRDSLGFDETPIDSTRSMFVAKMDFDLT